MGHFMKDTNNKYPKKLNLGCGFDKREGYLNIDLNSFHEPDLIADICNLGMLPSDFYDEIVAQDVLEHIPRTKTKSVLAEWNRLLKIGGTLKLRVPNLLALLSLLNRKEYQKARKQEEILQHLFGTQKYNGDFHHIAFTELLLKDYLMSTGFTILDISYKDKWLFDVIAQKVEENIYEDFFIIYKDLLAIPKKHEFLVEAYLNILGREPDKEGFDYYLSMLDNGRMNKEALIETLLKLHEIEKRARDELLVAYADLLAIPNDSDFLVKAYLDILGRKPDTEGFDHYISMLDSGKMSKEVVVASLSNLREIEKRARNELLAAYADLLAIPNDSDFLVKAYLDILGREPDTEGFDHYISNLTDHKMTREAIIKALLDSAEGKAMKFSNVSLNPVY
jgi:predicted SAM-dependent methyltransferase